MIANITPQPSRLSRPIMVYSWYAFSVSAFTGTPLMEEQCMIAILKISQHTE